LRHHAATSTTGSLPHPPRAFRKLDDVAVLAGDGDRLHPIGGWVQVPRVHDPIPRTKAIKIFDLNRWAPRA
jgi:hypothetical protein